MATSSKKKKKKTTTKKSTSTKKKSTSVKKKSTSTKKKSSTAKKSVKKVDLPKLKEETKEKPKKVTKVEEIKKEKPSLPKLKEKDLDNIVKKPTGKKKSNANRIASSKRSKLKKKIEKVFRKIKIYGIRSVIPLKFLIGIPLTILLLVAMVLIIIYLPNNSNNLDLQLIPNKVDQLKTVAFDINEASNIVKSSEAYSGLKEYYEYDFDKIFGLNKDHIAEYVIKYNEKNKQAFIAIKPTQDNHDYVIESLNSFFKSIGVSNYEHFTYSNYIFYINSSNNTLVKSKVMQTQVRVFNILKALSKEDILKVFDIEDKYYDEVLVKTSMVVATDTTEYIIIKPKNAASKNHIKEKISKYYENLENKWKDKNIENYYLVTNRLEREYRGYLIYIVSYDNDLVMELFKS